MTHALIIGGGIAGPVTAMALRKAGLSATVYEAYPTGADDVGAFLTIMSNGLDALRAVDLHELVLEHSFRARRVEFLSGSGKRLGEMPLTGEESGRIGPRTLKRATLYRVLHDELRRRGIPIEHGRRLVDAGSTPGGGVVATFADGGTAEGDLLVGADGIHSATRALVDPAAPRPRYTGLHSVYGYTRDTTHTAEPNTYRMIYGKRAFFGYTTDPDGETWWFANTPGPERDRASTTAAQWREFAAGLFTRDRTPAAEIIRSSGEDVIGSNAYDLPSVPAWHRDGMLVVGDAAHAASPNAGQGASMAAEDGVVLAQCLRDLPDVPSAFRAYERLRRERVERLVAASARMGDNKMPGLVKRLVRDALMPRMLARGGSDSAAWLTRHHIEWSEPVS
ncbi:2-polyprenyl-6-methoxyphenol hydroxylase [Amycolatopsis arida]|uniref:2-polyprenyl-6-methoxyphenol hydroxylase n=1 Tax=Amycolatopsis arida TaxID=587909 RepID=A0A1I5SKC6_9PSEU|nr:FAD-dependent monooxygenase [Amycolatopsis arida]TDX96451.1 2-polyprenyl-6-methoxyphenol hydroxylase-like FAD-dependent oxidoreductase [Amycolatopsis arida]SFP71142.1 2-polyprenyl-6-methoxyphenol hydroxylase [Amycolatopsis arida]